MKLVARLSGKWMHHIVRSELLDDCDSARIGAVADDLLNKGAGNILDELREE